MNLRDLLDLLRKLRTSEIPDVVAAYQAFANLWPLDFADIAQVTNALTALVELLDQAADVTMTDSDDKIIERVRTLVPDLIAMIESGAAIFSNLRELFSQENQIALGLTAANLLPEGG